MLKYFLLLTFLFPTVLYANIDNLTRTPSGDPIASPVHISFDLEFPVAGVFCSSPVSWVVMSTTAFTGVDPYIVFSQTGDGSFDDDIFYYTADTYNPTIYFFETPLKHLLQHQKMYLLTFAILPH